MGWPDYRENVGEKILCYYNNRHELTIQDGLILKGDRIIVPSTMRKEILSLIHHGHQGIETIKNRARSAVYWPNVNKQLEEVVRCCDACQERNLLNLY